MLGDLRCDPHLREVVGQLDIGDPPDNDVLVLDEGLAGLDAFGGAEHDLDGRPLAPNALDSDPDGD